MAFTTQSFLFFFFPIAILLCFICATIDDIYIYRRRLRLRLKDWTLFVLSIVFYGWSRISGIAVILFYAIIVHLIGLVIETVKGKQGDNQDDNPRPTLQREHPRGRLIFIGSVALLLCFLFLDKYVGFAIEIWNRVFHSEVTFQEPFVWLGISFITFSAISYLADIYRGDANAGSFIDCALYLCFFPKIVSGPIVLWKDFSPQKAKKVALSANDIVTGINRISVGFAKKLILADMFGACLQEISSANGIDIVTAWGSMLLYMFQIYYDFSGYSDIAIGLSVLFGYRCSENFNFPYRSCSITEFWRRWHISLGTWFREYVYIPLGGNRTGKKRTLLNLGVVFLLTGFWHGASWGYILWGIANGTLVIIERLIMGCSWYNRVPRGIKFLSTFFVIMLFWGVFRFNSVMGYVAWIKLMLGLSRPDYIPLSWKFFFTRRILFLSAVAFLGATLLGEQRIKAKWKEFATTTVGYAVQEFGVLALLLLSIIFMVSSSYSPFIYFQY